MAKTKPTFEDNLEALEDIIADMERGDLGLKDLMDKYTAGVKLAQKCRRELENAERTLDVIVGKEQEIQPLFLEEDTDV